MAPWTKLYRDGATRALPKPAPPAWPGAYQEIFMPVGPTKRTSVRWAWKGIPPGPPPPGPPPPPRSAPAAATAPGGPPPGIIGTPGGEIPPAGGIAPGRQPLGPQVPETGRMPESASGVNVACCTRSSGMLVLIIARAAWAPALTLLGTEE